MYNVLFLEKQICHRLEENSCKRSDKKLLTKYLKKKNTFNSTVRKPIKKWTEDLNRHLAKEDTQMAKKA